MWVNLTGNKPKQNTTYCVQFFQGIWTGVRVAYWDMWRIWPPCASGHISSMLYYTYQWYPGYGFVGQRWLSEVDQNLPKMSLYLFSDTTFMVPYYTWHQWPSTLSCSDLTKLKGVSLLVPVTFRLVPMFMFFFFSSMWPLLLRHKYEKLVKMSASPSCTNSVVNDCLYPHLLSNSKAYSVYGLSQWQTILLCNAVLLANPIHITIPEQQVCLKAFIWNLCFTMLGLEDTHAFNSCQFIRLGLLLM